MPLTPNLAALQKKIQQAILPRYKVNTVMISITMFPNPIPQPQMFLVILGTSLYHHPTSSHPIERLKKWSKIFKKDEADARRLLNLK
jgi:hypothetical protein